MSGDAGAARVMRVLVLGVDLVLLCVLRGDAGAVRVLHVLVLGVDPVDELLLHWLLDAVGQVVDAVLLHRVHRQRLWLELGRARDLGRAAEAEGDAVVRLAGSASTKMKMSMLGYWGMYDSAVINLEHALHHLVRLVAQRQALKLIVVVVSEVHSARHVAGVGAALAVVAGVDVLRDGRAARRWSAQSGRRGAGAQRIAGRDRARCRNQFCAQHAHDGHR